MPSPSSSPSTTVQAPQSPSPQPSLVPVHPRSSRSTSSSVRSGGTLPSETGSPRRMNLIVFESMKPSMVDLHFKCMSSQDKEGAAPQHKAPRMGRMQATV